MHATSPPDTGTDRDPAGGKQGSGGERSNCLSNYIDPVIFAACIADSTTRAKSAHDERHVLAAEAETVAQDVIDLLLPGDVRACNRGRTRDRASRS